MILLQYILPVLIRTHYLSFKNTVLEILLWEIVNSFCFGFHNIHGSDIDILIVLHEEKISHFV